MSKDSNATDMEVANRISSAGLMLGEMTKAEASWAKVGFLAGCVHKDQQVEEVIRYCRIHLSEMWAANIVGILLNCDFRDAHNAIAKFEARIK